MKTRLTIRSLWSLAAAALLAAPALGSGVAWGQTSEASFEIGEEGELPQELRDAPEVDAETGAAYARLLYYEGGISLRRPAGMSSPDDLVGANAPLVPGDEVWTTSDGRAEVQLADGSILRIDRDSRIGLLNLADLSGAFDSTTLLRLPSGSLYIQAANFDARERRFQVDTPSGSVFLLSEGIFRIDVGGSGTTSVSSFRGVAELLSDETSAVVHSGERIAAGPGNPPGEPRAFNTLRRDDFDLWAEGRDSAIASARSGRGPAPDNLPAPVRPYVSELSYYGSWQDTPEYGWVWVPGDLDDDWRPYYYGRWTWAPIGMVWVSSEPWGYAPYHYGRWHWTAGLGWFWAPGYVYSGAYVQWAVGPYYYGWCPIGYYGYPVVYAGWGSHHHHGWSYVHHHHIYYHNVHRHVYGYADVAKNRMREHSHYLRNYPRAYPRYDLEKTGRATYRRAHQGKGIVPRQVPPPTQRVSFKERDRREFSRRAAMGRGQRAARERTATVPRSGRKAGASLGRAPQRATARPTYASGGGRARQASPGRLKPTRASYSSGNSPKSSMSPSRTGRSPVTGRSLNRPVRRSQPAAAQAPVVRRSPARSTVVDRSPSSGNGRSRQPVTRSRPGRSQPHGRVTQGRGTGRSSPFIMVLPDGSKKTGAKAAPRGRNGSSRTKMSRPRSSGKSSRPPARRGKGGGGSRSKGSKKK